MKEFDAIFKEFTPVVYHFLLSLCGNESLAEELTSETFYQAYLHIGQFRGDCKIETWLCQIAKYEYYAWDRRQKKCSNELDENSADLKPDMLNCIIDQEDGQQIRKILHELQEPYKEVFMFRVMGEVSYRDIGQLFGKSESWARVTYYRAKKMIVEKMGGGREDEM